jgi:hypothetical protein
MLHVATSKRAKCEDQRVKFEERPSAKRAGKFRGGALTYCERMTRPPWVGSLVPSRSRDGGSSERGTLGHDSPTRQPTKPPSVNWGGATRVRKRVSPFPRHLPWRPCRLVGGSGRRSAERAPRMGEHAPHSRCSGGGLWKSVPYL